MLKFRLEEILEGGIDVVEERGVEWFGPLLIPQFKPAGMPVRIEVRLVPSGNTVLASGRLTGRLAFVCSRCAEDATLELDQAFSHVFIEGDAAERDPEDDLDPDQPDFTYIEKDEIDLESLVRDELVLLQPLVPLCADSCRGLCQRCGTNLNQGPCGCKAEEVDPRWAKLRELKL